MQTYILISFHIKGDNMAHIISFAIQKGGCGKTTSVVTTAHALGELNKKVLVVDLDPQHNASLILGKVSPYEQPRTVIDLFEKKDVNFSTCSVPSKCKNVDLISSHIDLFAIGEQFGPGNPKQIVGLKNKLDKAAMEHYDFVLIDCTPALGGPFLNNALVISNYYVIPLESESYFALKGVQQFLEAVDVIKDTINPDLQLLGVLITMADMRTQVTKAMIEAIHKFFGENDVFKSIITRNTSINKAAMLNKTVIAFDSRMSGASDYREFAKELVEWLENRSNNS